MSKQQYFTRNKRSRLEASLPLAFLSLLAEFSVGRGRPSSPSPVGQDPFGARDGPLIRRRGEPSFFHLLVAKNCKKGSDQRVRLALARVTIGVRIGYPIVSRVVYEELKKVEQCH